MSATSNELRECQAAYDLFKMATGEAYAGAYLTPAVEDQNLRAACEWGTKNLPGGFAAFKEIGAFDISFRECVKNGTLRRDPAWLSRGDRKALFVKFNNALPAETAKIIYFGLLSQYNGLLTEEQATQLSNMGGEAAFKMFMDEA